MMKKIEGHNLYKNDSGAVVFTDKKKFEQAKQKKLEKNKLEVLEQRMERIEQLILRLVENNGNS